MLPLSTQLCRRHSRHAGLSPSPTFSRQDAYVCSWRYERLATMKSAVNSFWKDVRSIPSPISGILEFRKRSRTRRSTVLTHPTARGLQERSASSLGATSAWLTLDANIQLEEERTSWLLWSSIKASIYVDANLAINLAGSDANGKERVNLARTSRSGYIRTVQQGCESLTFKYR